MAVSDPTARGRSRKHPPSDSSSPLCAESPAATVDIIILIMVLGACGVLLTPYLKYIIEGAAEIVPATIVMIGEVVWQAPLAYGSGALFIFIAVIGGVEIYQYRSRRCHNPRCKGLKKSMEFDIQLQTEECLKAKEAEAEQSQRNEQEQEQEDALIPCKGGTDLRAEHKELEHELRRMAPPNGKAIMLFRAPCGCPIAKLEAWGPKRSRRSKR